MLQRILYVVVALFPISEMVLAFMKRSRDRSARSEDRGSMRLLWLCIALGVALAVATEGIPSTRIQLSPAILGLAALALLVGGLLVRWVAILTLGRLFTVDVAIHADHAVVQSGVYRYMRHPSYTGLMTAFLGLGLFLGNWLSMAALAVAITPAVLNRVAKEERALLESLGPAYAAYRARTKRFIPGLV